VTAPPTVRAASTYCLRVEGHLDDHWSSWFGRFTIARETDGKTFEAKSASKVQSIYKRLGSSIAQRQVNREISSWFVGAAALLLLASIAASRLTGARLP